ncbi:MAG: DEAD/DEAH box helicase family protein [Nannocystis sp.]|nr:DEAD/DEAH box helicase family protein [Nannocystis sp.]
MLADRGGLLLIAPTGIGKTVMTAYAAKVLIERGQVARVILVCKNEGMRENWTKTLRKFQIVAESIRVYALERSTSEVDQLFEELRPNDLVIVDECHHFRNRFNAPAEERDAATKLPDGVQATTHGPHPGLYILLRVGDARVSLFRPEDSDTVEEAPADHPHEHFLHRIAHGERLKPARSQNNLDPDIDNLLALHFRDGPPDECQLVAALKILRSKDTPPHPAPTAPPKPKRPEQLRLDDLFS